MTTQAPSKEQMISLDEVRRLYDRIQHVYDDAFVPVEAGLVKRLCAELCDQRMLSPAPEPRSNASKPVPPRNALWDYMQEQHGLALLESELDEIERLAKLIPDEPPVEPVAWMSSTNPWLVTTTRHEGETSNWIPLYRAAQPPPASPWIKVTHRLPESGVPVLAFVTNELGRTRRIRAQWCAKFTEESDGDDAEYCEEKDTYYSPEGWYESNEYDEVNWFVHDPVSHWMPLPEGPTATKGEG